MQQSGDLKINSIVHSGGIYDHEHEVFMECEALTEAANSLATHNNLLLNPVTSKHIFVS